MFEHLQTRTYFFDFALSIQVKIKIKEEQFSSDK